MSILKSSKSSPVPVPLSPRSNLYHPNGKGRDSYIYNNNGGLFKSGQRIIDSLNSPSINNIKLSYNK
jgi:hypothetical protein